MRNRSKKNPVKPKEELGDDGVSNEVKNVVIAKRSGYVILALFILVIQGLWAVHHYQFEVLPEPLSAETVGKRGFSEVAAMKHVEELVKLGPHSVGSDALELGLQVWRLLCYFSTNIYINVSPVSISVV